MKRRKYNMAVHPITLDLRGSDQIEYSNIAYMTPAQCININVSQVGICSWIVSKGGITGITIPGIFELVDAYIGIANIGFIPTITEILGAVDYYLGFTTSGNTETGCSY
jgi:hypothetical protein